MRGVVGIGMADASRRRHHHKEDDPKAPDETWPISTVASHPSILLLPRPIRGHPSRPAALRQDGRTMHAAV